jgi:2-keto-4-pentenoate hydratase/2-oxohepta-3-ene-1,7-dioic acid hydratase in catechol pathway
MRIANARANGRDRIVVSEADGPWMDLTAALPFWQLATEGVAGEPSRAIGQLLDAENSSMARIEQATEFARSHELARYFTEEALEFRAPFSRPGQIIALARNYSAHAKESTLPIPHEPIFFSKSNTSVIGPGEPIVLPPNLGRVEPEIELAFVIGKRASHVPAASAADYIAGFTILNDVSAQELQAREIRENYPLFRCKSLETFTPMGPWLVTIDEIGLQPALDMTLRVNGEVRVATNTIGLTFGIAQLVEFISGYVVLYPGDIITTGCPKAAGGISPGDELELEIEKIGILRNPVVQGTEPSPA